MFSISQQKPVCILWVSFSQFHGAEFHPASFYTAMQKQGSTIIHSSLLHCSRLANLACTWPQIGGVKNPCPVWQQNVRNCNILTKTGTVDKFHSATVATCLFVSFLWGKLGSTNAKIPFEHPFCGCFKIIWCIVWIRLVMRWCSEFGFLLSIAQFLPRLRV